MYYIKYVIMILLEDIMLMFCVASSSTPNASSAAANVSQG